MNTLSHEDWSFIQNQFLNATVRTMRSYLTVSDNHLSALRGEANDAAILPLIGRYEPLHDAFLKARDKNRLIAARRMGATARITKKLAELSQEVGKWNVRVQVNFYKDTPEYLTIFPDGLEPFYKGSREEIIEATGSLANACDAYPLLGTLTAEIRQFHTDLESLNKAQKALEQDDEQSLIEVREAHKAAADMMYRNLGALMNHYGADYRITTFFQLDLIRRLSANPNEEGTPEEPIEPIEN